MCDMIFGIDVAMRRIAIAEITQPRVEVYELKKPIDRGQELRDMGFWLSELVPWMRGGPVYLEAAVVAGARNIQSTIKVAQTIGAVMTVVPGVQQVAISSWKLSTVGNGNASKQQVRDWLDLTHPDLALLCDGNQDLYDATCIALHGQAMAALRPAAVRG
jgi:Holliday junction resolvasome RuvABC endonuclease subunit